jgi:hypothetical protein
MSDPKVRKEWSLVSAISDINKNICWLEITVHKIASMQSIQSMQDAVAQSTCAVAINPPIFSIADQVRERSPCNKIHHDEEACARIVRVSEVDGSHQILVRDVAGDDFLANPITVSCWTGDQLEGAVHFLHVTLLPIARTEYSPATPLTQLIQEYPSLLDH